MKKKAYLIVGMLIMVCSTAFANLNSILGADVTKSGAGLNKFIFIRLFILFLLGVYIYLYFLFEKFLLDKVSNEGKINIGVYLLVLTAVLISGYINFVYGIVAFLVYIQDLVKINNALKNSLPVQKTFSFTKCFSMIIALIALIVVISFTW